MAKVLMDYEFRRPGNANIYPWNEWLDGQIWQLKRGEDFQAKSLSVFRSMASVAAIRRGLKLRTSVVGDTLTIQARKETEART